MKFIKATEKDLETVHQIVSESISVSYLKCYSQDIVDFFLMIHNKENIKEDIKNHSLYLISDNDEYVGTGCAKENHITRVYILPKFQGKGYGSGIMDFLEGEISKKYKTATLDPSLLAIPFYEKRGYKCTIHREHKQKNGEILVHDTYEKKFE